MSESEDSQPVAMDPNQATVPPWLAMYIGQLDASGKKVLRTRVVDTEGKPVLDAAGKPVLKYNDARALREFIGLELIPQLLQMLSVVSDATAYSHHIADGASTNLARLKQWATGHFRALGARELEDEPGLSRETIDAFGVAFFALGSMIKERFPNDDELVGKYNAVVVEYAKLIEEARTGGEVEDEDDDEDGDEDESDEDE